MREDDSDVVICDAFCPALLIMDGEMGLFHEYSNGSGSSSQRCNLPALGY